MTRKGLIILDPIQRLVTHKDYAIEMVNSIIKETDLDPFGEHSLEDLGASSLRSVKGMFLSLIVLCNSCILILIVILFQILVQMKALQDRCVANEGVIRRFCKH